MAKNDDDLSTNFQHEDVDDEDVGSAGALMAETMVNDEDALHVASQSDEEQANALLASKRSKQKKRKAPDSTAVEVAEVKEGRKKHQLKDKQIRDMGDCQTLQPSDQATKFWTVMSVVCGMSELERGESPVTSEHFVTVPDFESEASHMLTAFPAAVQSICPDWKKMLRRQTTQRC